MVSTTITFEKDNVQPPVYIAGSFTGWSPIEMSFETSESDGSTHNVFSYKADLEPGDYQYKFRLGPVNDEQGNVNNITSVKPQVSRSPPGELIETISKPVALILNTKDAHIIEDEPEHPSEDGLPPQHEDVEPYPPAAEVMSNILDSHGPKEDQKPENLKGPDVVRRVHFDGGVGKLAEGDITTRKDSIPDFAPPPYSIATNGTVLPPAASPTDATPSEKRSAASAANSHPDTRATSLISRMCKPR
ncbi:hypothetical protein AYL99_09521 [Fonsecaea erecta]|uniref:AMP-activated protein kinase glycogen-binding domain-containing protein n=1 Tax=Fonsecaea erecta TaxID=1367422 RepID=A0A178Z9J3_9EURO|nr:hypothetical protein AYL99_09521 [Fonsecaea erecta]OAP56342.1 hypothetical protein AYL99_09521 [Fonsecaea erecta]